VDTKDFLLSVVPWDNTGDYVTIVWQREGKFFSRSCQTINDVLTFVASLNTNEVQAEIYFCLSSQCHKGRSRKNVIGLRAVWFDLDVGSNDPKKYATVEEALMALLRFCLKFNIPFPSFIVMSGGGLHVYWASDRTLSVEDWQPFANALKTAAQQSGLKADLVCTVDAVRILRVPGTNNWKTGVPRPVRFLENNDGCNGIQHDFTVIFAALLELVPAAAKPAPKVKPTAEAFKHLDPNQALGEGIIVKEIPPLPLAPLLEHCGWIREAYETGGKNYDNKLWNLTTLAATWLEDGHALAHRFGNQHPTYSPDETDREWDRKNRERRDQNIGWPRCGTIQTSGCTHCSTCSHLGTGQKSPLNLAHAVVIEDVNDKELKDLGGKKAPWLPEGYALDEKERISVFTPTKIVKKEKVAGRLFNLFLTQIKDPSFRNKDGMFGVGFTASTEKDSWAEVFLPSSHATKQNLFAFLAKRFVLVNQEKGTEDMIMKFMPSWLDKLRQNKAVREQGTMGWRYEEGRRIGFVYGNTFYSENGNEIPLIVSADDEFRSWYRPQGKAEVWRRAAKLLTDRKRPELDIIIAIAFAAPLVTFAGTLYGAILSIWGDPGTSKSTAQQVAASVWGHPKQTRESLNSTPKSVQGRLGRTRNLPAFWDDVQDERHQGALFDTMFVASEGAEGGRLNPDASMKVRLEWQTLLVACSNASFVEYLVKKQRSTTAGMRRVFEVEFQKQTGGEPGIINALTASQTFAELEHNYGMIGAAYAKILACEHREIQKLVSDVTNRFTQQVKGDSDESYWWGICGALIAGSTLANRLGAEIDVAAMEEFLVKAFLHNRKIRGTEGTEGGSYDNTEHALSAFLNFYVGSGNHIVTDITFEHRHTKVQVLQEPMKGRPLHLQIARDERKIIISKRSMRAYLNENEINPRSVFNGLVKYFRAFESRLTLGAGTVHAQTQELCFEINVPPGQFEFLQEVLVAQGPPRPKPVVTSATSGTG
jgi:hypothetical protein